MNNEPELYVNEDGIKFWYLNGIGLHREDGPAIIFTCGTKQWWLNDCPYTYENYFKLLTPEQQYNYLWNLDE
jgi:hypothetical protein